LLEWKCYRIEHSCVDCIGDNCGHHPEEKIKNYPETVIESTLTKVLFFIKMEKIIRVIIIVKKDNQYVRT